MSEIAVVILNWNGKSYLQKFLPIVVKFSRDYADIFLADNASNDGSVEYVVDNFADVRIIRSEINRGYAEGYNFALSKIKSDFFILLNSDIEVTENWISPVIALMKNDPTIAACQPKMLSYVDRNKFEYAGAAGGFIDKWGYPFCRGRLFQSIEIDNGQYDDTQEIFWATGACMFIRSDLFFKYGGFDNDFFAHMEEIDLCWRLKNAGYRIMFCPLSKVFHVGGGTLPKISSKKTYLNFRNNIILLYKNLPKYRLIIVFPIRLILDGIAGLKFLFDGGYMDFLAVIKAHVYFYLSLKNQRDKRKKIAFNKNITMIYRNSIVFDYYIRGKRKFSNLKFL